MKPTNSQETALSLYDFEMMFIPSLINTVEKGYHDAWTNIGDAKWLSTYLKHQGIQYFFDINKVQSDLFCFDNTVVLVITFPQPPKVPYAKYGAVVKHGLSYQYFTLELSWNDTYALCIPDIIGHRIIRQAEDCSSAQQFAELLYSLGFINEPIETDYSPKTESLISRLYAKLKHLIGQ